MIFIIIKFLQILNNLFFFMLYSFFFSFEFFRFCQSGCYLDFFYKKCSEVFVRNVFIYAAQFFGENYMIEVFTKKIFSNFVYFSNYWFSFYNLQYNTYFIHILIIFFYFLTCLNFFFIFFYANFCSFFKQTIMLIISIFQ